MMGFDITRIPKSYESNGFNISNWSGKVFYLRFGIEKDIWYYQVIVFWQYHIYSILYEEHFTALYWPTSQQKWLDYKFSPFQIINSDVLIEHRVIYIYIDR